MTIWNDKMNRPFGTHCRKMSSTRTPWQLLKRDGKLTFSLRHVKRSCQRASLHFLLWRYTSFFPIHSVIYSFSSWPLLLISRSSRSDCSSSSSWSICCFFICSSTSFSCSWRWSWADTETVDSVTALVMSSSSVSVAVLTQQHNIYCHNNNDNNNNNVSESAFLFQRLSVLIQRYKAVVVFCTFAHIISEDEM